MEIPHYERLLVKDEQYKLQDHEFFSRVWKTFIANQNIKSIGFRSSEDLNDLYSSCPFFGFNHEMGKKIKHWCIIIENIMDRRKTKIVFNGRATMNLFCVEKQCEIK